MNELLKILFVVASMTFVTWLKSGNHPDETLRSAALAMRHSSKMQASAAYDRDGSNRLTAAAVRVATDYADTFVPRPSPPQRSR